HALARQTHCHLFPKPACEACSQHCYDPAYRREIRDAVRDVRRTLGPRVRLGVIDPGSG
ncbi:MAG: nitrous oxide-stimulated promoter family protein, partial [Phycisphaerae bacterium]|nr:nitrous oxide-stimulated promoter family protein [Phycisphaerae bacterium]